MDKIKSEPFIITPAWVWQACDNLTYLRVYEAIRSFANAELVAYPSRKIIAIRAGVSTRQVDRALNFLQGIGAIVIEHQFRNNQQVPSVYVFKNDRPAKYNDLTYADRRGDRAGDVSSERLDCPVEVGETGEANRTRTTELEPIKEKEKYKKEKEPSQKAEAIEEFVSKVRAIYPKREGNMGWLYFTQRAATHFKTVKSKDDFLLAVQNYKNECAKLETSPRHVMMPSTFIAKHGDYVNLTQESCPPRKVLTMADVAPWKEIDIEDWT